MPRLILNIEDNKFQAFLSYLRTLDYVSIDEGSDVPQWQKDEVARRLALIDSGKMGVRSWDEAEKDVFRK
jgi:hypothetical protein